MTYTKPRGTVDLINNEANEFCTLEKILRYTADLYNFSEIRTPIFEHRELFKRAVGETSDIVNKEFYDFQDKGERWIVLRPEGTAGTIRALVENKLLHQLSSPLHVFYLGPMFRYERPQSGRQRQFNQFGVEVVGDLTTSEEVETLAMAQSILNFCKVKKYTLQINNIGDIKTRGLWIAELQKYFSKFVDQLSEDSQKRLLTNPLRILDDKIDGEKEFVKNAPKIDAFLSNEQKQYFEEIKKYLDALKISYTLNDGLVRGLDYYCGLVFEFVSESEHLKGQSTIIGGGRYDQLVEDVGGPALPGFGYAIGLERLLIAIKEENPKFFEVRSVDVVVAVLSERCKIAGMVINNLLRNWGISSTLNHNTYKLEKHFKFAENNQAKFIVILGDKELAEKKVKIKNQLTKNEELVDILAIPEYIQGVK